MQTLPFSPAKMKAGRDLAVVRPSECPGVLPRHTDGVGALLREPRVVDDQRLDAGEPRIHLPCEPAADLVVRPVADRHALLEPLPHRFRLRRVADQPRRHRFDALALAVQEQASRVERHRVPSLHAPHPVEHLVGERLKLTVQGSQLRRGHAPFRSQLRPHGDP